MYAAEDGHAVSSVSSPSVIETVPMNLQSEEASLIESASSPTGISVSSSKAVAFIEQATLPTSSTLSLSSTTSALSASSTALSVPSSTPMQHSLSGGEEVSAVARGPTSSATIGSESASISAIANMHGDVATTTNGIQGSTPAAVTSLVYSSTAFNIEDPAAYNGPATAAFGNAASAAFSNAASAALDNAASAAVNKAASSAFNNAAAAALNVAVSTTSNVTVPAAVNNVAPAAVSNVAPPAFNNAAPAALNVAAPTVFNNAAPSVVNNAAPTAFDDAAPIAFHSAAPLAFHSAALAAFNAAAPAVLDDASPTAFNNADPAAFNVAEHSALNDATSSTGESNGIAYSSEVSATASVVPASANVAELLETLSLLQEERGVDEALLIANAKQIQTLKRELEHASFERDCALGDVEEAAALLADRDTELANARMERDAAQALLKERDAELQALLARVHILEAESVRGCTTCGNIAGAAVPLTREISGEAPSSRAPIIHERGNIAVPLVQTSADGSSASTLFSSASTLVRESAAGSSASTLVLQESAAGSSASLVGESKAGSSSSTIVAAVTSASALASHDTVASAALTAASFRGQVSGLASDPSTMPALVSPQGGTRRAVSAATSSAGTMHPIESDESAAFLLSPPGSFSPKQLKEQVATALRRAARLEADLRAATEYGTALQAENTYAIQRIASLEAALVVALPNIISSNRADLALCTTTSGAESDVAAADNAPPVCGLAQALVSSSLLSSTPALTLSVAAVSSPRRLDGAVTAASTYSTGGHAEAGRPPAACFPSQAYSLSAIPTATNTSSAAALRSLRSPPAVQVSRGAAVSVKPITGTADGRPLESLLAADNPPFVTRSASHMFSHDGVSRTVPSFWQLQQQFALQPPATSTMSRVPLAIDSYAAAPLFGIRANTASGDDLATNMASSDDHATTSGRELSTASAGGHTLILGGTVSLDSHSTMPRGIPSTASPGLHTTITGRELPTAATSPASNARGVGSVEGPSWVTDPSTFVRGSSLRQLGDVSSASRGIVSSRLHGLEDWSGSSTSSSSSSVANVPSSSGFQSTASPAALSPVAVDCLLTREREKRRMIERELEDLRLAAASGTYSY